MIRIALLVVAIFLLIAAYAASPFLGLYRIISAVQTRDVSTLSERVDFRHLRQSLTSQIIETYLKVTGRTARLGQFGTMAIGVGAAIADPLVSQIVSPQGLIALFESGRVNIGPQSVAVQLGPWQAVASVRSGTLCEIRITGSRGFLFRCRPLLLHKSSLG
jgi:DUF2939 family protein